MNTTITNKVKVEETRALAAEKALSDRIDAIGDYGLIEGTYDEIYMLWWKGELIPGRKYAINDYECCYIHPSGGTDEKIELRHAATDVVYIILTATSTDKFDYNVQYIRTGSKPKIIECKYTINSQEIPFTKGMTKYSPKGTVFYMKDEFGNECTYDFKHVRFRRYAITDITANMDINDGTGGFAGPYRCMNTDNCYKFSDTRKYVGSGDEWENTFIPALFNGKWGSLCDPLANSSYASQIPSNYSDDYIKEAIKPYKNTTYPWDKYLSWQTNMREQYGLSAPTNQGPCQIYGQANVEVDSSDYKLRYTFDYNGEDASDMYVKNDTNKLPIVANNSILYNVYGNFSKVGEQLPNNVIAISTSAYNYSTDTIISAVKIVSESATIPIFNTFLIRNINNRSDSGFKDMVMSDGAAQACTGNLMIFKTTYGCNLSAFQNNLLVGQMLFFNANSYMKYNVLFGTFNCITCNTCDWNLLWGSETTVKYESDTSYHSCKGNDYWYNVEWRDFFYSNVMGPFQYSSFGPHVNGNTFRTVYNKGVSIAATFQLNSLGQCAWGVHFDYGGSTQYTKFGNLAKVRLDASPFASNHITTSSGVEKFNNSQTPVPNIFDCDVKSSLGTSQTISSNLSSTALNRLSVYRETQNRSRTILTHLGGKWKLYEVNGVEIS